MPGTLLPLPTAAVSLPGLRLLLPLLLLLPAICVGPEIQPSSYQPSRPTFLDRHFALALARGLGGRIVEVGPALARIIQATQQPLEAVCSALLRLLRLWILQVLHQPHQSTAAVLSQPPSHS